MIERDFVAGTSTLALGALIAPPMIVPRHVLGRGYQAPSDTLNIAYVGADLQVMQDDTRRMRGSKPFVMCNLKTQQGVSEVVRFIEERGLLHVDTTPSAAAGPTAA